MKRALLLSGGYDCVAAYFALDNQDVDLVFFDYAQSYVKQEIEAITAFKNYVGKPVKFITVPWGTDIKNRNFYMISRVAEHGYDEIITGSRNILPLFDKYKDSNWWNLKKYARLLRIKITLPVCLKTKKQIIKMIPPDLLTKLYSTEK